VTNESKQPPCSFLPPDSTAGDGFDFDFDFKLRIERRGGPGYSTSESRMTASIPAVPRVVVVIVDGVNARRRYACNTSTHNPP
jgi:hypothetical protein